MHNSLQVEMLLTPLLIETTKRKEPKMKVQKITTQPEFQPVTLQITIESQDELVALKDFTGSEYSIPECCAQNGIIRNESKGYITDFLSNIYKAIRD